MLLTNTDPGLARGWHPVAWSEEVGGEPRQVWLLGRPWVLVRLGGALAAFEDRCPHRRAPLSAGRVEGDRLRCAYHGWCFGADGRAVEVPALGAGATLPPRATADPPAGLTERYGLVWLAPETPAAPLIEIPEAEQADFVQCDLPPVRAAVGAGLMADNFLDFAHFPFIHAATIGAEESSLIKDYSVDRGEHGFEVVYEHPFANHEDPGVAAGQRPLLQTRTMTYRYRVPFSLALRLEYREAGGANVVCLFIQPETAEACRLYMVLWRTDVWDEARRSEVVKFEEQILTEDLWMQEQFPDKALPLELTSEVHTRADRITMELRRYLARMVGGATDRSVSA